MLASRPAAITVVNTNLRGVTENLDWRLFEEVAGTYDGHVLVSRDECGIFHAETEEAEKHIQAVECEGRENPRGSVNSVVANRDEQSHDTEDATRKRKLERYADTQDC